MTDFLNQIAAVFSLGEDATEAQVLAAAHAALASQVPADHVTVTAARLTELERNTKVPAGHEVVANGVLETYRAEADKAKNLAKELSETKFELAFKAALDDGRATPFQKDYYSRLFEKDEQLGLDMLAAALPQIVTHARGDAGLAPDGDMPDGVDADRHDLDRKVRIYAKTHNIDYLEALDAVASQEVRA